MSSLLNSGWQLTAHGAVRVAASTTAISSGFDEIVFTFILTKDGKYVLCAVDNPKPPIANASSCRKLN